jgi:hypothetical protein
MTPIITIDGVQATLLVFEDHLVITSKGFTKTLFGKSSGLEVIGSVFKSGEKTIPFNNIQSINYKKSGFTNGHLIFNTGSGISMGTLGSGLSGDSFVFGKNSDELAIKAQSYIHEQIEKIKNGAQQTTHNIESIQNSQADEIRKFKQLLDDGIISQDEFDAKKKSILNL